MTSAIIDAKDITNQDDLAIKPLIVATPTITYQMRAARLASLAADSGLTDYFNLLNLVVKAQAKQAELGQFGQLPQLDLNATMPLAHGNFEWGNYWQSILLELVAELLPVVPSPIQAVLRDLSGLPEATLQQYAEDLLSTRIDAVPAQYSLFIWAALSVYWSHVAATIEPTAVTVEHNQQSLCPICGSHPVASVIKSKPREGLRYLHCSLCESQWHRVRAECTNCEDNTDIHLWSEKEKNAELSVESCGCCHSYTKMMFTNVNPELEVVADDLATLFIAGQMQQQGFHSTNVNPLLLSHQQQETEPQ
ncbi:formate dehydrogenase accessory protein FdhE [Shewanella marina]|uniref:formate dehydrogenase accessory protein FdhE n=1 Tax=Shewanella marina TaxID=487319 RepID=UPI000471C016|nr:formate dehydrogenase accessory protein FdhE [Shewanella marina]